MDGHYVVLDIETAANDRSDAYVDQKRIYPAANLKDPAKIEQSILSRRQAEIDAAALQWWTGKVISIAAYNTKTGTWWQRHGDDEADILKAFFTWLDNLNPAIYLLIGKSSADFDLPFLVGRAIAHDMGVPDLLRTAYRPTDIDHLFSRSSTCSQRTSLANYAWGMGINGKSSHGSQVKDMYLQAQLDPSMWDKIRDYNIQDVTITAELLKRYQKPFTSAQEVSPPPEEDILF